MYGTFTHCVVCTLYCTKYIVLAKTNVLLLAPLEITQIYDIISHNMRERADFTFRVDADDPFVVDIINIRERGKHIALLYGVLDELLAGRQKIRIACKLTQPEDFTPIIITITHLATRIRLEIEGMPTLECGFGAESNQGEPFAYFPIYRAEHIDLDHSNGPRTARANSHMGVPVDYLIQVRDFLYKAI